MTAGGCTLEDYANAKNLPTDFLEEIGCTEIYLRGKPAVRMPYCTADGTEAAVKFRVSLDGDPKTRWKSGSKPLLYGLNQVADAAGPIVLVEGESDTQTLWLHGFTAVGLPGASQWNETRDVPDLERFETIYVVVEPDKGGDTLLEHLAESQLLDRIRLVDLDGPKDVSELHQKAPDGFVAEFQAAVDRSVAFAPLVAEQREAERVERAAKAWEICADLATSPNILDEFARRLPAVGLVGETRNAKVLYLALTSRLFPKIVSVIVKGQSSSGKSFETETVLKFMPDAAFKVFTSMSERMLIYSTDPIDHRHLVFFEATGMRDGMMAYLVRTLLSEGRLLYETTIKNPKTGEFETQKIERKGPTGVIVTTTAAALHEENETRHLTLWTDDGPEQTKAILRSLAADEPAQVNLGQWQALQTWLEAGPRTVHVPFARDIAEAIPPVAVRLRRDFSQLLAFIKAHALLHRATRETDGDGRIVATFEDYAAVRALLYDVLSEAVAATVRPVVRETVNVVSDLLETKPIGSTVTVAQVAARLNQNRDDPLDNRSVRERLKSGISEGYLDRKTERHRPIEVAIGAPMPDDTVLIPTVDALLRGNPETEYPGTYPPSPPSSSGIEDLF